jgi:hypothetical protein
LQWAAGYHNGAAPWRSLPTQGFRGSLPVVTEWATRRRRADKVNADTFHRVPSARTIARLMTIDRNDLSKAKTVTVAAVEAGAPSLVDARRIIECFHVMIRRKASFDLDPWIAQAHGSLVASFANGVAKGYHRGSRCHCLAMVEGPDRGTDHQAQAGQTSDVRPWENRPGSANRRDMTADHQNCVRANIPRRLTFDRGMTFYVPNIEPHRAS